VITLRRPAPAVRAEAPAASLRALGALVGTARRDLALLMLLAAVVLGFSAQDPVAIAPQGLAALAVLSMGGRAEGLGFGALGRLGLLVACVAFAFVPGGDMTHVLLRFLCAISAVSLLKPKSPREHGFLLGVTLLETALAWALADGWGLLLAGIAFAVLAHRALASWHRWRGALRVVGLGGVVSCPAEEARGTRASADRAALATILIAVPLFLVLPRTEMPLLSLPGRGGGGGLGVGDEVRLRGLGALGDPDEPVGSAEPKTAAARGLAPYLRAAAFESFDGRTWTDGGGEDVLPLDPTTHRTEAFGPPLDDDPVRFAIVIDAGAAVRLPLLEGTSSISFRDPAPDRYALHRRHGTVRAMHPRPVARHVYVVEAPSTPVLPGPGPTTARNDPLLELPPALRAELLPAVFETIRGLSGDRARAEALVAWVRDRASYDLGGAPAGPNPVGDFLFRTRRGHCEYFASALACCLRVAGIPSRLVAGWHASRWNGVGGFWTLRRGDAHAWVEASLDGGAWVRFDATPAGVLDADPYAGVVGFLARIRDAIDFAWNRDVLAYDPTAQRKTLRTVAESVTSTVSALLARTEPLVAAPLLVLAVLVVLVRRRSRARAVRGDPTASGVAFYARCLRALRRRGLSRHASEAPLAFSARAADALDPAAHRALSAATDAFLRVRYGGEQGPPDDESESWVAAVRAPRGVRKGGQPAGVAVR